MQSMPALEKPVSFHKLADVLIRNIEDWTREDTESLVPELINFSEESLPKNSRRSWSGG